jgi:MFS family permease
MIDTFGIRGPMVLGALLTSFAMAMMAFLNVNSSLSYVVTSLFCVGTGLGMYFTACSTAMMRSVPQEDLNVASGVFMMFMMVGNTLSIILSTSFVVIFGRDYLWNITQEKGMPLVPEQHQQLAGIIAKVEHSASQLTSFSSEQIPFLLHSIDKAFVYGFSINMIIGAFAAFISASLTLWGIRSLKAPATTTHAQVSL